MVGQQTDQPPSSPSKYNFFLCFSLIPQNAKRLMLNMDLYLAHLMTRCTTPVMKVISFSPKAGGVKPHVLTVFGLDFNDALVIHL